MYNTTVLPCIVPRSKVFTKKNVFLLLRFYKTAISKNNKSTVLCQISYLPSNACAIRGDGGGSSPILKEEEDGDEILLN